MSPNEVTLARPSPWKYKRSTRAADERRRSCARNVNRVERVRQSAAGIGEGLVCRGRGRGSGHPQGSRHGPDTVRCSIAAAQSPFGRRGFKATSFQRIAERVGITAHRSTITAGKAHLYRVAVTDAHARCPGRSAKPCGASRPCSPTSSIVNRDRSGHPGRNPTRRSSCRPCSTPADT